MGLLELIIGLLLVFWILGFALHIAGGLIHVVLVLALILFVIRLFQSVIKR